jgi:hypothetical protein
MSYQADVGDDHACYDDEDEWGGPGRDLVRSDAEMC